MSALKARLQDEIKVAMKTGLKDRLQTLRLISSDIKQIEVDTRVLIDDAGAIAVLEKMLKRRRDSIEQFGAAGRQDLVDKEAAEVVVVQSFLPEALSDAELDALISAAMNEAGASSAKDMGKVISLLKPRVVGRADMQALSAKVKARLG